jgi:hypothetical protein
MRESGCLSEALLLLLTSGTHGRVFLFIVRIEQSMRAPPALSELVPSRRLPTLGRDSRFDRWRRSLEISVSPAEQATDALTATAASPGKPALLVPGIPSGPRRAARYAMPPSAGQAAPGRPAPTLTPADRGESARSRREPKKYAGSEVLPVYESSHRVGKLDRPRSSPAEVPHRKAGYLSNRLWWAAARGSCRRAASRSMGDS